MNNPSYIGYTYTPYQVIYDQNVWINRGRACAACGDITLEKIDFKSHGKLDFNFKAWPDPFPLTGTFTAPNPPPPTVIPPIGTVGFYPHIQDTNLKSGSVIVIKVDNLISAYTPTWGNVFALEFIQTGLEQYYTYHPWDEFDYTTDTHYTWWFPDEQKMYCEVIQGLSITSREHRGEKVMCEQDYRRTFASSDQHRYNIRFKIWNFDTIDTGVKHKNKNSKGEWDFRL